MADKNHPTRLLLLDAALALADQKSLTAISVDDVVRGADVAKGTFYVHFSDRTGFLVALHARFHEQLRESIRSSSASSKPGFQRIRRSTIAYLDGCLGARGVKAMLASARGEPVIAQEVARSNDRFAHAAVGDFRAMGHRDPLETARLFVAMTAEVALLELDKGEPDAKLRRALWHMVT
jgi:TetR/AcrR family transcriptional repressor of nem operon